MNKIENIDRCPLCGSTNIFLNDRGELVCGNCGLVIEENYIDNGRYWTAYSQEEIEKKDSSGAPYTYMLHDKGLHTEISPQNTDFDNKPITTTQKIRMHRLRKLNKREIAHGKYSLIYSLKEIGRMASVLNSPEIIMNEAANICHRIYRSGTTKGRKFTIISAVCIYLAYRKSGIPIDIRQVYEVSEAESLQQVRKAVNFYRKYLGLSSSIFSLNDYLNYFMKKLNPPNSVREDAISLAKMVKASGIHRPEHIEKTIAATILYLSFLKNNIHYRQMDFADICGISEISLRAVA
ncbi:MAG: transcription initiation factor IIB, partial [Thermoplasmata archaeon]